MDYKIRDIELASFYLAWQHTAFYKPRDSAASFRIGRNRETITRSDDPPPASQDPIASLNVSIRAADFVSDHKVCCSFYYAHTLIHCRGPPSASDSQNQMHSGGTCMLYWQRLNTRALLTKPGHSPIYHFTSDALWLIWANPPLTIGERSERGQVTASAGMEGGEDLELSPSQKTSIRYQFEVFCKKVIRGERCDYLRQVLRRAEQEVSFSDMPFDTLLRIGMSDDYPSSHYVFETQGHQISIADERLGEALSQIESAGRNLLLLAYFLDLNDREIGALLGIPRSTIQRRRQRFLDQMKQLLKE